MSIVNFSLPKALEKRINEATRQKGFASKAEFFRFAAIYYLDIVNKPFLNDDDQLKYLTEEARKEIVRQYGGKILPSAKQQLSDLM